MLFRSITLVQEDYGSNTRSGVSPIVYQETIYMGDGIYMDVTLEEDFAQAHEVLANTRAESGLKDLSEGAYKILGYQDGSFVGMSEGEVVFTNGVGEFRHTSDFAFENGVYDFVCVKNVVLSDNCDAAYVNRATASVDAALISEVIQGEVQDEDLELHFIMRHKESGIRFRCISAGNFEGVNATISTTNAKPSQHKYNFPGGGQDASATLTAPVDAFNLTPDDDERIITPYQYFLPGTTVEDLTLTFTGGTVWGKSLKDKSVTLNNNTQLERNTLYTVTITCHDGVRAFDGVIAIG